MIGIDDFALLTVDCYGTVIDWERGILSEIRPLAVRNGRADLSDDAILENFAITEAALAKDEPKIPYPLLLQKTVRRLATSWGFKASASEAKEFGHSVARWPAFADSASSLQYLQRYYKLCVISNVDHASFASSNRKLDVEFDAIYTAEDLGSYKPNVRNFEIALKEIKKTFGIKKSRIMHVAHSIFHDIAPARSIGLATLRVNRRKEVGGWGAAPPHKPDDPVAQADFEVPSLAEFVALHQQHLREEK